MLVLVFHVGAQRFGIDALDVLEIVPWVALPPLPGGPPWIAGLLQHRDGVAPVVDLARLLEGRPSAGLLSTRIVVLRRAPDDSSLIGLLAERVSEAVRIDDAGLQSVRISDATWRGPIALDAGGPLQLVRWTDLVPAALRATVLEGAAA